MERYRREMTYGLERLTCAWEDGELPGGGVGVNKGIKKGWLSEQKLSQVRKFHLRENEWAN